MQFRMLCLISNAQQSRSYEDTCYVDVVDLEKGKECQLGTRTLRAADFLRYVGRPVMLTGDMTVQSRRTGGGLSLVLNQCSIKLTTFEAATGEITDDQPVSQPEPKKG